MKNVDKLSIKNKIALSTISQAFSQILVAALAVIILKLLTRNLGTHDYGTYAIIFAFITVFSLLTDLGINAITGREIAKHPDLAQDIISDNMTMRLSLSLVMVPVISGLGFLFYPNASTQLRFGIFLLSFDLILDSMRSVSLAYFTAKVKSYVSAAVTVVSTVLFLTFVIVAVVLKLGVLGIVCAYLLSDFFSTVISLALVNHQLKVHLQFRFKQWPTIVKMSVPLGVIQIVNMFYLKADSILLSIMRTSAEVGYYTVAYSIINMVTTLPSYLMVSLIPSITTSTKEELQDIAQRAFDVLLVVSVMVAVVGILMRNEIIVLLSGKNFLPSALPLAILLSGTILSALNSVCGFIAVALDKYRKLVFVSVGNAILNILINVVLIPKFGIKGAASATLITEVISFAATYVIFSKATNVTIKVNHYWKVGLAAIGTIVVGHYLLLKDNFGFSFFVAVGVILSICYVLILVMLRGLPKDLVGLAGMVPRKKAKI